MVSIIICIVFVGCNRIGDLYVKKDLNSRFIIVNCHKWQKDKIISILILILIPYDTSESFS